MMEYIMVLDRGLVLLPTWDVGQQQHMKPYNTNSHSVFSSMFSVNHMQSTACKELLIRNRFMLGFNLMRK